MFFQWPFPLPNPVAISGFSDDDESCTTEGRVAQVVAISVASWSHFDGKKNMEI